MRIFVCEFVTGGGLYREPLPAALAAEGGLMLQALLADLAEIPGVELVASRDGRLPPLPLPLEVVTVGPQQNVWQVWEDCLQEADALWPIAPESGGVLERLSRLAWRHGKRLLNSAPQAVVLTAAKQATLAALAAHGLKVVPTFRPGDPLPPHKGAWVAKPDDGAGCADSRCFDEISALMDWLAQDGRRQSHVIQPYMPGTAASLSMLCLEGKAWLLSCNRQLIQLRHGVFRYQGSVLNAMAAQWEHFVPVVAAIADAIPGLAGYVGVDILVADGEITVLEVNPRLTTSYAGLRRATGCNPAGLVLELLYNGRLPTLPAIARNLVEVSLE